MNDLSNPFQGTGDWLAERVGCATASRMNDVRDFRKDGKPGAARIRYMKELLAERMTGNAMPHVVTQAMRDGLEREPEARALYEAHTGNIVRLVGFIRHPEIENAGASPDGLVDDDGLIECKAPTELTHVSWMLAGVVPEEHVNQILFQLACTGRQWCDFVSYCPTMKDPKHRLFVRRYVPPLGHVSQIEDDVRKFLAEVDAAWEVLNS